MKSWLPPTPVWEPKPTPAPQPVAVLVDDGAEVDRSACAAPVSEAEIVLDPPTVATEGDDRHGGAVAARLAHNQEVAGSIPACAPNFEPPSVATDDLGAAEVETETYDAPPEPGSITLWEFFQTFIAENGIHLPLKPMHREVCDAIEAALMGEQPDTWFYIFNMPPRIGKTKLMEAAVCWHYGLFPQSHFIWTSFNNPLACESSRYIQRTLNSEWYHILFPSFRLGEMQQADNFTTEKGGRLKADGVNAMLAGFGAGAKHPGGGAIVIDDPANPNEALSKIEVEKLQFWLENTIMRRRNSDRWTPIFIIAQRLGGEDLCGYVLKNYREHTKHLKFQGGVEHVGGRITSNFPETISGESLEQMRSINKYAFSAQIQQDPEVLGGNMIQVADFKYFDGDAPLKFDWLSLYCDTAWKTKEHNDYSVVAVGGRMATGGYLLDAMWGKWESPEMIANIRQMWRKWQAEAVRRKTWLRKVVIEDHASGTAAIQFLRREGIAMEPRIRTRDKAERVQDVLPFIASGQFHVSRSLPYLKEFVAECSGFRKDGKHAHDDFVDCAVSDLLSDTLGKPLTIFDVLGKRPRGR